MDGAQAVIVAFVYMLVTFRQPDGPIEDGPPLRGHAGTRNAWLGLTVFVVLVLAAVIGYVANDTGVAASAPAFLYVFAALALPAFTAASRTVRTPA